MKLVLVAIALAAVALAGCAKEPAVKGVVPPQDEQGRYVIHLTVTNQFSPVDARVPANATVVWVNDADVGHDVVGYKDGEIQSFSSDDAPPAGLGRLIQSKGEMWAKHFGPGEEGIYGIACHPHHESDNMLGTLKVGP